MSYKITIERIETKEKQVAEYERLHDKKEFDSKTDPQYGYVYRNGEVTKEEKIYEQTLDQEIDLKAVIDAFNE